MKKPKVAILDNSLYITGALNAILTYAEFSRDEVNFLFILPRNSKASEKVMKRGFEVLELPFVEISKSWKSLFLYLPYLLINSVRLSRIVKVNNVDIVHVNDIFNLTGVVAKLYGGTFKLLTHVRFMPDRFPMILMWLWIQLNLKYAAAVICVSTAVKNLLPNHLKIVVIYDGLPNCENQQKRNLGGEKKYLELLYLGHYIPGKGQDFALEAFASAYKANTNLRLKYVGGDMGLEKNIDFKERLLKRAEELEIQEQVSFLGPVEEPQNEIMSADIVLNFSESESFSMTCLEALLCGIPLIATNCGGPAELFVHSESGILIPNRDIQAMSSAILQVSEDESLRNKFRLNSPNYVINKFSKTNTFVVLKKLYYSLV